MIKYIVSVAYHDFLFDNAARACEFAATAKMTSINKNGEPDNVHVEIEIELIEEQEENENGMELQ